MLFQKEHGLLPIFREVSYKIGSEKISLQELTVSKQHQERIARKKIEQRTNHFGLLATVLVLALRGSHSNNTLCLSQIWTGSANSVWNSRTGMALSCGKETLIYSDWPLDAHCVSRRGMTLVEEIPSEESNFLISQRVQAQLDYH